MKKLAFIFTVSVLLLGFSSCNKDQCKDGDGYPRLTVRQLPPFTEVDANLSAIIELVKDTAHFVELEVEQNVETHITTVVNDNKLNISLGFCFNSHAEIIVRVHYDSLNVITVSGPGDVVSNSLMRQENLTLNIKSSGDMYLTTDIENLVSNIEGPGNIELNGQVRFHQINHTNSGNVNSYQAMTDSVIAYMAGTGNAYLRVKRDLYTEISSSGNLYYRENPKITEVITGTGKVINDN